MSRRSSWLAQLAAAVLFAFSFYVLQHWLERGQISDIGGYQYWAGLMRSGQVPYRDFAMPYPPVALPAFLLPEYMSWSYATSFAVLMGVCGAGCIALLASALRAVGASNTRIWGALLLFAVSPIVLGSVFDTRFDLWPALLGIAGLAAAVRERPLLAGGLLGLGFAAKLWPVVLLPVVAVHLWRRRGRYAALDTILTFLVIAAAFFVPFAILAPHGLWSSLSGQLDRPLQVESLGAAVLLAAEHFGMAVHPTVTTHGAQALTGPGTRLAADLETVAEISTVVFVWIVYARRRTREGEAALVAGAAAVAAVVAFDKVLSPQYLIWIVPFVVLVRGARGLVVAALMILALGLTQTWFPRHYWDLAAFHDSPWTGYLLARDVALVALAAALVDVQPRIRLRRRKSTFAGRSASLRMR